jgi:hypothetical protein
MNIGAQQRQAQYERQRQRARSYMPQAIEDLTDRLRKIGVVR